MRISIVLTSLSLAVLAFTGCGDSSTNTPVTPTKVGPTYTYSPGLRTNFMKNCVSTTAAGNSKKKADARTSCACALQALQDRVPEDRVSLVMTADNPPQDVVDAVRSSIQLCQ